MRGPRTLVGRLFAWQIAVLLVLMAGLGFVLDRALERHSEEILTESLASQAGSIRAALPADTASLEAAVVRVARGGDLRVTVIRTDGVVVAESEEDPALLENHRDRPEVRLALGGHVGTATRRSATLGVDLLYVALPPQDGRIVRVAYPLTRVRHQQAAIRLTISLGLLAAAAAACGGVLLVSRGVSRPLRRMTESLQRADARGLPEAIPADGPEELRLLADTLNRTSARLEETLRDSESERHTRDVILSSMEEGVLLAGPDGDVSYANPAAERHLGTRPSSIRALLPIALREAVEAAATGHETREVEVETGNPPRWLRGEVVPVGDDGSVLLVFRDITQARRLDAVRRDFVANASHELKTPAASIRAAAETIRDAVTDDPGVVPRFAEALERDALRLSRIVSDLLDLSRLESGSERTERVPFDGVVGEEAGRLAEEAASSGVHVDVSTNGSTAVRGSERDLRLLVRNLVDNAVRYTAEGGRVHVSLAREDGWTVLRVEDTGVGIPSRDLPRIFERFYRVDRARSRETGGTGLGLAIVKHVAENHGGTVAVESELGRGTSFEVRLPTAD